TRLPLSLRVKRASNSLRMSLSESLFISKIYSSTTSYPKNLPRQSIFPLDPPYYAAILRWQFQGKEVSNGKEANQNCTPEIGHEQSWKNGKGNSFRLWRRFSEPRRLRSTRLASGCVLDDKFGTSFCSTRWKSYHEVFSSGRKRWRFDELITRYLDVRNAVAAHANPRPPFPLREDQVLEIQRLVASMLYDAAGKPDA